jgi:hypothetical protein
MTDTPRKRRRGPTLSSALTQALKAGVVPVGATIAPDGSVSINFGKRDDIENSKTNGNDNNPWDEVLIDAAHKERAS